MILRYGVESKHTTTFTASRKVRDEEHAKQKVEMLKRMNKKAGHMKYFSAVLYTDDNIEVCRFSF